MAGASQVYAAEGTVRRLFPGEPRVEIEHGDIEGLMPAMRMEFEWAAEGLPTLRVGQRLAFGVRHEKGRYRVVRARLLP